MRWTFDRNMLGQTLLRAFGKVCACVSDGAFGRGWSGDGMWLRRGVDFPVGKSSSGEKRSGDETRILNQSVPNNISLT